MASPQIEQMRAKFDNMSLTQKKAFIDRLKVQLQGKSSPFLNECIREYNTAIRVGSSPPASTPTVQANAAAMPSKVSTTTTKVVVKTGISKSIATAVSVLLAAGLCYGGVFYVMNNGSPRNVDIVVADSSSTDDLRQPLNEEIESALDNDTGNMTDEIVLYNGGIGESELHTTGFESFPLDNINDSDEIADNSGDNSSSDNSISNNNESSSSENSENANSNGNININSNTSDGNAGNNGNINNRNSGNTGNVSNNNTNTGAFSSKVIYYPGTTDIPDYGVMFDESPLQVSPPASGETGIAYQYSYKPSNVNQYSKALISEGWKLESSGNGLDIYFKGSGGGRTLMFGSSQNGGTMIGFTISNTQQSQSATQSNGNNNSGAAESKGNNSNSVNSGNSGNTHNAPKTFDFEGIWLGSSSSGGMVQYLHLKQSNRFELQSVYRNVASSGVQLTGSITRGTYSIVGPDYGDYYLVLNYSEMDALDKDRIKVETESMNTPPRNMRMYNNNTSFEDFKRINASSIPPVVWNYADDSTNFECAPSTDLHTPPTNPPTSGTDNSSSPDLPSSGTDNSSSIDLPSSESKYYPGTTDILDYGAWMGQNPTRSSVYDGSDLPAWLQTGMIAYHYYYPYTPSYDKNVVAYNDAIIAEGWKATLPNANIDNSITSIVYEKKVDGNTNRIIFATDYRGRNSITIYYYP